MTNLHFPAFWATISALSASGAGLIAAVTPDAAADPIGHANALLGLGFLGVVAFVAIGLWVWTAKLREDDRKRYDAERQAREEKHEAERERIHREFQAPMLQAIERNSEATRELSGTVKELAGTVKDSGNIRQVLEEIRKK